VRKGAEEEMQNRMELFPATNPNPVLSVAKDGTVLYSNEAGKPLLCEWNVKIGEKLSLHVENIVQRVISLNIPEKMEVKVGSKEYVISFHPLQEEECVNIYGFDIGEQKEVEEKLRESKKKYRDIVETANEGIWRYDGEIKLTYVNKKMADMLGYCQEEMIGKFPWDFTDEENKVIAKQNLEKRRQGISDVHEFKLIRKDGSPLWVLVSAKALFNDDGKFAGALSMYTDITERKSAEQEREIMVEFLSLINESKGTANLIHSAMTFFRELSGFEAVGIRLKDGDNYSYFEVSGFPEKFLSLENSLSTWDATGQIAHDSAGYPIHECMCGNIIHGRFDPSKPFFTKRGSFYSNCNTELLTTMINEDHQARTRNRCDCEGYESVALIALRAGEECLGLLQLNDKRKGQFTQWTIAMWERLADYLAVALTKTRAEDSLQQAYENLQVQSEELQTQSEELQMQSEEIQAQSEELQAQNEELQVRSEELREAYEALWESEDQFRVLIRNLKSGVALIDETGRFAVVNPSFMQIFGLDNELDILNVNSQDWSRWRVYGENGKLLHVDDHPVRKAMMIGKPVKDQLVAVCNPGVSELTWMLLSAEPILKEEGNIYRVICTYYDITERKKNEEALRKQAVLIDLSPDGIIVRKLGGEITFWSNGAETLYGWTKQEAVGQQTHSLFKTVFPRPLKDIIRELKQNGHWSGELIHRTKDGQQIVVQSRWLLQFNDKGCIVDILESNVNITKLKQAEEALKKAYDTLEEKVRERTTELEIAYKSLKESEEKYRNIVETTNEGILAIDSELKITFVNKQMMQMLGYTQEEMIGRPWCDFFDEEGKAAAKLNMKKRRQGLDEVHEFRLLRKDGSPFWVLVSSKALQDKDGKFAGSLSMLYDISERKKAEEVLKLKMEELRRSNEELEQFAYVSSHDLQEPLRMISSYLQLLQRRYQGKLDEKADKYIYFAVDGAVRMQTLINDLLELSRVATRAREPEPTNSELVLDQVLSSLDLYIKQNRATITHDSLPEVIADSTQLGQLFQNLIANGIKFHSEKPPEIYVSAEKKANEWLFSVKDNGIGIDPQYFEKIFEVFKRLHKKENYPGTGIGLAICKKIVERHGGCIWVESEVGKGATFYFTLPNVLSITQ
jgi:PAS domain S-box-containing protein